MAERNLGPGRASLAGLKWLACVGPTPIEAWAIAFGWDRTAVFSHASRLNKAGWTASCTMRGGQGSLIYATRVGTRVAGVSAAPIAAAPAPTTWAHWEACGWVAAWLTARGRHMIGARELLLDPNWLGELEWVERNGVRQRGHRPDLVAGVPGRGSPMPIEVELTPKSTASLRAILSLHASWIGVGKAPAVIYVCGSSITAERITREGARVGLRAEHKTLRVEMLDSVREAATAVRGKTPGRWIGGQWIPATRAEEVAA